MTELATAVRAGIERHKRALTHRPDPVPISLCRALEAMLSGRGLQPEDGVEGLVVAAAAEVAGQSHDPLRIRWPLELLGDHRRGLSFGDGAQRSAPAPEPAQRTLEMPAYWTRGARDLTTSSMLNGGALVDTDQARPWEPLRPWSPVLQGGATVWSGLQGDVAVPRVVTDPQAYWLANQETQITEGQHVLGTAVMTPKHVACYVEVSRRLLLQTQRFEALMRSTLLRAVGQALDRAVFNGSGASGEPLGVLNTAGIGSTTGAGLDWADIVALRKSVVGNVGGDRNIAWVGGKGTQEVLTKRERAAGSGKFIWDDLAIGGAPAFVSSVMIDDGLMVADWSQLIVGLWGDSVQIEMNPYANFQSGIVGFRVILSCDIHVVAPAYFSAVSGVN